MRNFTTTPTQCGQKEPLHHAFKHIWPLLVEHGAVAMEHASVSGHPLTALYEPLLRGDGSGALVIAQLGQSLDGRIATPTGHSRDINGSAGLDHLHRLRSLVDAVVVGCGTVLADDPQLTTRRVSGRSPARVLIDPRGRSRGCTRWIGTDAACLVFSDADAWPSPVERVASQARDGRFEPASVLAELTRRGLRRVLVEGGSNTISRFIDAGLVDRLHVSVAPIILGSGRMSMELAPIDRLESALRPKVLTYMLEDGDVVFDCDLRNTDAGGSLGKPAIA